MQPRRFAALASWVVVALIAVTSLIGLLVPSIYAHELPAWRLQARGQDGFDLVVIVPWLALTALATWRGSRRGALLLAGGLAYTVYTFVIYTFAVHWNQLFLVYVAIFGLALRAFAALWSAGVQHHPAREPRTWHKVAAAGLMTTSVLFAILWLSVLVPATVHGTPPAELAEVGLATNPVHVLDLAIALPLMFGAGRRLWRGEPDGAPLATIALVFAALMGATIVLLVVLAG